jgi:hypothetical protein
VKSCAQPTTNDPKEYVGLENALNNATVSPFMPLTSRPGLMFYPGATSCGTYGTAAEAAIARQGPDNFQTRMWWDRP